MNYEDTIIKLAAVHNNDKPFGGRREQFSRRAFGRYGRGAGKWQYRGTVLDGDPKYIRGNHGVMRFIEFGQSEFLYQCYGNPVYDWDKARQIISADSSSVKFDPLMADEYHHTFHK